MPTPPRRVLFAGLYSGLTAGAFYGFGIYSPALKRQLGLTQFELTNINTIPYVFGVVSFIWGAINQRAGPRFSMACGA
jgi:sugar phosphate permease